jgi:hypothetical protein
MSQTMRAGKVVYGSEKPCVDVDVPGVLQKRQVHLRVDAEGEESQSKELTRRMHRLV